MPSRALKATLAMVPVLAGAAGVLWAMYAPTGYRYEFEVVSRTTLDSLPLPEQQWRGVGGERAGGALFFRADESAIMTEREGVMPLLADTTRWAVANTDFRPHQRIEVIAENVDVHGWSTQQRLVTSHDTLFVTAGREPAGDETVVRVETDGGAMATTVAVADSGDETVVRVGTTTISRATAASRAARAARGARDRRRGREKRFVRATHTETYVWTTEDVDPRIGRAFERFADSLVMLASHRSVKAIRDKHRGQSDGGPYRGVALRVVSTAVTVDSLGRRREVVTRAEVTGLDRDRNAVARVHRRKLEHVDRTLSRGPSHRPSHRPSHDGSHPDAPPPPPTPPAPVAAVARP